MRIPASARACSGNRTGLRVPQVGHPPATDEQALVISLRFLEGYSFGEIAEMMDKTEGAVKALQHRAVATLRQLLVHE